jgi:Tol biopolymer transport system component
LTPPIRPAIIRDVRSVSIGLLVLCLLAIVPGASAESPSGPRLLYTRISVHPKNSKNTALGSIFDSKLISVDATGAQPQVLVRTKSPINGAAWSPDGSAIAFVSGPPSDLFLGAADGSGIRRLTRLSAATSPVFAADGQTIYFARSVPDLEGRRQTIYPYPDTSIWKVGLAGGEPTNLTEPSRTTADVPGSVSPLTGALAVSHSICVRQPCPPSIALLDPATAVLTPLLSRATDPAFSPDGRRLAFVSYRDRNWPKRDKPVYPIPELYVLDLPTGALQRLTATRHVYESTPSWDPSGQRIAFDAARGHRLSVMEINADGTCKTRISSVRDRNDSDHRGVLLSQPIWQPGATRGAGPIVC